VLERECQGLRREEALRDAMRDLLELHEDEPERPAVARALALVPLEPTLAVQAPQVGRIVMPYFECIGDIGELPGFEEPER
jgi:hypothetical protein